MNSDKGAYVHLVLESGIKADPLLQGMHLVMLTSLGMRGDAARVRGLGFSAYLTKPVKQSELLSSICAVLARATTPPGSTPAKPDLVTRHSMASQRQSSLRVMVVDDNEVNWLVAQRFLTKAGYLADVATDGQEALAAAAEQPYDIILMDCQMPVMDGYDATRALRLREGTGHHTIIIAMTAAVMSKDEEACRAAGMDDFLSKPLQFDVLQKTMERWAQQVQPAPPMEETPLWTAGMQDARVLAGTYFGDVLRNSLGDGALAKRLVRRVQRSTTLLLLKLRNAIAHGVPAEAAVAARGLKRAAESISLEPLRERAEAMEMLLEDGDVAGAAARLDELEQLCAAFHREVETVLGKDSP
jgi:CheY-like chemotaxis protein